MKTSTKARSPAKRGGKKLDPKKLNQATSAEFEKEGMGVAPKE